MMTSADNRYVLTPTKARGSSLASCTFIDKKSGTSYYAKSNVCNTIEQSYLQALQEKISLSIYSIFNIPVLETTIQLLPIIYSHELYSNDLLGLADSRKDTYYLCTELKNRASISSADLLNEPLIAQILATSILINDIDALGNHFNNILVTPKQNGTFDIYKIDAGESFFPGDEINLENLRICTQGENTSINLYELSYEMRRVFFDQLKIIKDISSESLTEQLKNKVGEELYCSNRELIDSMTLFMLNRKSIMPS